MPAITAAVVLQKSLRLSMAHLLLLKRCDTLCLQRTLSCQQIYMRRHWKLWILAAVLLAAIAGAGKLVALAVITLLLPVYGLLWMSFFLIGFVILAVIVVPIGRNILEHRASVPEEEDISERPRRAA